ncbi:MAG: hypothetical protein J6W21_10800 [Bacteroidaceae bacterium]|nr:hypothetical protein [Bacteroidaceae bacterium]
MKKKIFLILVMALMTVTSAFAQTRELQIYKGGSLIQSFPVGNIDSIKVGYAFNAPGNVSARLSNKSIVVTWSTVSDAQSYQLYRSGDNKNFVLLAGNLTTTAFTDNSPLKGTNYYKVKAIGVGKESAMSESTGTATLPGSGMESGLYLGVMGFNQLLTTKSISILKAETKSSYDTFIDAMTMKNGTILCYSVDQAINALQKATLPDDIFNVAIVTFTDGLDQGSLMMDDRFENDDDFLAAIKKRITEETVAGQSISAYSIGLRGRDITSASDIAKFQSTLKQLASTNANAKEVTSMAEVNAKFQEIAEQLNSTSYLQTISLKIPGLSNGTRVRFTFDNVTAAANSKVYIEGTFNLRTRSLTDVVYKGMTSTSGTTINGTTEGIFITFKFDGIRTENGKLLSKENIDEWYLTSSNSWQINSEFDKYENSDVINEKKSAAIMLVLDCSSSLDKQFSTMQANAKSFVNTLFQSTKDADTNGHEYVDLGLPSGTLWATYNVGASKPEEYGDYFAWGETKSKSNYSWSTYKYCKGSSTTMTKYCTSSDCGTVDNKTELEPADDAATANWGTGWQMPSLAQQQELINTSYTTTTWTTQNGVYGRKIISKSNGNSIFLPAAGYRYATSLFDAGSGGDYWSRSLDTSYSYNRYNLYFSSSNIYTSFSNRICGQSVRPVRVR